MAEAFEITGADQLQALAGKLARVPPAAKVALRRNLRAAAEPMKTSVQAHALGIPVHGETATGLRSALAKAVKIRTNTTISTIRVRVFVDPNAMPSGQAKLPALMEGAGWKHPVFGRGSVFQPGHAYFKPAVDPLLPPAQLAALAAVDEATRSI